MNDTSPEFPTPAPQPPAGYLQAHRPLPGAEHLFGTRAHGGTDASATVHAAAERFGPIAHMRQVHGNRIVKAEKPGLYEDCDAIYTTQPGLWMAVKTADCAPVLLACPGAVAAIHVGWRGLQNEILPLTIQLLANSCNTPAEEMHVALGPCLTQPHFEVEDTFQTYFNIPNSNRFFAHSRPGHVHMDFPGLIRAQALAAGILDINFHATHHCTFAEAETFNSYRREKEKSGRQISLIRLTE